MADKKCVAVLVVIGALLVMTISLIATSLKKLASDESKCLILLPANEVGGDHVLQ